MTSSDADDAYISSSLIYCVGNLVGIAVTTSGTFLVLVVPLVVIYYQIQSHYRKTNTELKRISSIARSPIFTQFSSTLSGVAVIRAFGQGPRFIERMDTYIDAYSAVFYVQSILRFWLAIRLDALGGCIAFFVAALAVSTNDFISPEEVAIALSFSFTIPVILATLMTLLAEIEGTY
jgi:ABC-type multidrug transport system fused ATPase/permease subunit